MKRFLAGVVLLGGCAAQPSPALVQLQGACQAGNVRACESVVAYEQARGEAIAELFSGPVDVYQPVPPPRRTMTMTDCLPMGTMISCTTY